MRHIIKFFDFLFKWKISIWLQVAAIVFLGVHYRIDRIYIGIFVFVGAVCYSGSTFLGLIIICSWFGVVKEGGKKFIALYLPFLIFESLRCYGDLRKGYLHNKVEDVFVSWVYLIAFGYATISLFYFLATSRVINRPITTFIGTRDLIETTNTDKDEA